MWLMYRPTVYKTKAPVKSRKMIISSSKKPKEGYFHMHWIIKFVDQSLKRFPRPSRLGKSIIDRYLDTK